MNFFTDKRITITGGKGFLGGYVIQKLKEGGANQIAIADRDKYDLRQLPDIIRMYEEHKPNIVIHLAAVVGGIGANQENPGAFFYNNAIMGIQLIEYARLYNVEKFVCIGTICAYPKFAPVPFKETDLWNGYPEETNAPYGLAKKMLLVQLQANRQQYGFNGIYLLPVNLYGPGDNFDPRSSHVIPALIKKFIETKETKENNVTLWGDGSPTREFIYAADAAEGILRATEHYNAPEPVNIGAGFEISIRELAKRIADLTGFKGSIEWDTSKPNGQPRRMLDTTRAREAFGFISQTNFSEGLHATIQWYQQSIS